LLDSSLDDVLSNPDEYRKQALSGEFHSVSFGESHSTAYKHPPTSEFAISSKKKFPEFNPVLTFLRKSPLGQVEPNFIHNDAEMGDVTAILYLNPEPPKEDGTSFWKQSGNSSCTTRQCSKVQPRRGFLSRHSAFTGYP
jgi:hypothetical protein